MMAKGTYATLLLATKDLDGTFERLQASDAEVVQEPTEQPYGVRDCAVRDPAGNVQWAVGPTTVVLAHASTDATQGWLPILSRNAQVAKRFDGMRAIGP
jgi:uncharacterized glyoxalase superfamily protein PhnB